MVVVVVVVNDGEGVSVIAPLKHRFIMFTVNVSTLSAYKMISLKLLSEPLKQFPVYATVTKSKHGSR
ncbi:hypothetical protein M0802_007547 [Mischocyttarus mexicanus]|nr:hypothetical protein M0802_007547 [Mischocyttarus mexicanus]